MKKIYAVIIAVSVVVIGVFAVRTVVMNSAVPKTAEKAIEKAEKLKVGVLDVVTKNKGTEFRTTIIFEENGLLGTFTRDITQSLGGQVYAVFDGKTIINYGVLKGMLDREAEPSQWATVSEDGFNTDVSQYTYAYRQSLELFKVLVSELCFEKTGESSFRAEISDKEAVDSFMADFYAFISDSRKTVGDCVSKGIDKNLAEAVRKYSETKEIDFGNDINSVSVDVTYDHYSKNKNAFDIVVNLQGEENYMLEIAFEETDRYFFVRPELSDKTVDDICELF